MTSATKSASAPILSLQMAAGEHQNNIVPCNPEGQQIQCRVKNYALDANKCLHNKRKNCDRPFINIIPKDGGKQLKLECSTGCFELLKSELLQMSKDSQISEKFSIVFSCEIVKDLKGHMPEIIIKASSRLASGLAGKRLKFTINIYNSQCSLLINGYGTPVFQDEILPAIMDKTAQKPEMSALDRHYAQIIDRCLKKSIDNSEVQTSICDPHPPAIPDVNTPKIIEIAGKADCSGTSNTDKDDLNICIHCNKEVYDGIACDNCSQWNHYDCERLDSAFILFYNGGDVPYSCLSCRQLTFSQELALLPCDVQNTHELSTLSQEFELRDDEAEDKANEPSSTHQSIMISSITPTISTIQTRVGEQHGMMKTMNTAPPTIEQQAVNTQSCNNKTDDHSKKGTQHTSTEKEKTKKKKMDKTENKSDLQQQLDYSVNIIHKLEKKVEELERRNKILHSKSIDQHSGLYTHGSAAPATAHTDQTPYNRIHQQTSAAVLPTSQDLTNRLQQLETEILRSRIANLEHVNQLNAQLQMLSMRSCLQSHATCAQVSPPYAQSHNPSMHPHTPYPFMVHNPHIMTQTGPATPHIPMTTGPLPSYQPMQVMQTPTQMMCPPAPHTMHGTAQAVRFPPPRMVNPIRCGNVVLNPDSRLDDHINQLPVNRPGQNTQPDVQKKGRCRPNGTRPPRYQHPPRRPHPSAVNVDADKHSTPKKRVRTDSGGSANRPAPSQSPILIDTLSTAPSPAQAQTFLAQGRATETTPIMEQADKGVIEHPQSLAIDQPTTGATSSQQQM